MRHQILLASIVIVVIAVSAWLYFEHGIEKERLWKKLSGDQFSTLAECLDYAQGVQDLMESCREIEETVNKATLK